MIENYFYQSVYKILTMILPIITIPIVSKAIGPSGIGTWNYINSIVNYFCLVAGLGISTYGVREIVKVRDDKNDLSSKFWELQYFNIIFSTLTLIVYIFYSIFQDDSKLYFIQSLIILGSLLDVSWFFIGIEEFKSITTLNLLVKVLAFVPIVLFVKETSDLEIYFWIQSLVMVLPQILFWIIIIGKVELMKVSFKSIKQHFKPSISFLIPKLSTTLNLSVSKTILGIFTTMELVGIYSNALSLVILSGSLIMAINDVTLPRLSYLNEKNEIRQFNKLFANSVHIQLYISIPIVGGICLITSTLIEWFFGSEFNELKFILPSMAPILIFQSLQSSLGTQYFIPKNRIKIYNIYSILGGIISAVISLCFINLLGVYSVISGVTLGYFSMCFFMSRYLYKNSAFRYDYFLIFKLIISSSTMFFFGWRLTRDFHPTMLSTIIQVFLGIIIYFVMTFILRAIPFRNED